MRLLSSACLLLALVAPPSSASDAYRCLPDYAVPTQFRSDPDFHPVGYLESCPVPDTTVHLSGPQLSRLSTLFLAASDSCRHKYHQDFPLSTSAPLYRLLRNQLPGLKSFESENGRVVFLSRIAHFLRAQPTATNTPSAP